MRVVEIEIGGMKRGLHFGTNASSEYCRVRGVSLEQSQEELSNIAGGDGSAIRDLIYSGLWAHCKTAKIEVDFDQFDVGNWIDDLGVDGMAKVTEAITKSNDSGEKGEAKGKKK